MNAAIQMSNAIAPLSFDEVDQVNGGGVSSLFPQWLRNAARRAGIVEAAYSAGEYAEAVGFWLGSGEWPK